MNRKILSGIITGVLVTTIIGYSIHLFVDLGGLELLIGLLVGIEAGCWVGNYSLTKKIHSEFVAPLLGVLIGLGLLLGVSGVVGVAVVLGAPEINAYIHGFLVKHFVSYGLIFEAYSHIAYYETAIIFAHVLLFILSFVVFSVVFLSVVDSSFGLTKKDVMMVGMWYLILAAIAALATNIIYLLVITAGILLLTCLCGYCLWCALVFSLRAAREQDLATIMCGTITGGIAGWVIGAVYKFEFSYITLSMVVGCIVGIACGYAFHKIAQMEFVPKLNIPEFIPWM